MSSRIIITERARMYKYGAKYLSFSCIEALLQVKQFALVPATSYLLPKKKIRGYLRSSGE
jgi:hypothetical protein